MQETLVIIGSGPAAFTAAIYAARAGLKPLIIEGSKPGGQLMGTSYIENWPGIKQVLGPELMMQMRDHAASFGSRFLSGMVESVDFSKRPFILKTKKETITAQAVIICTGASPRLLNVPGEQEYWGKGVTTCAVCDGAFYKDRPVVIVGGGDSAMENASFMTNFTKDITIIHLLDKLTASQVMQDRILNNSHIKVFYNSAVQRIEGDGSKVTNLVILNKQTQEQTNIATNAVFIAIGLIPNTQVFKGHIDLDKYGYIALKDHTQTSVSGVFAAGDVADFRYRQAITSAGTGCMAALDAERFLKENL